MVRFSRQLYDLIKYSSQPVLFCSVILALNENRSQGYVVNRSPLAAIGCASLPPSSQRREGVEVHVSREVELKSMRDSFKGPVFSEV
jgi:hypothetical protein